MTCWLGGSGCADSPSLVSGACSGSELDSLRATLQTFSGSIARPSAAMSRATALLGRRSQNGISTSSIGWQQRMTVDELPLVLSVPECARILRISKNAAYQLAADR
jgi:hypothetical protein